MKKLGLAVAALGILAAGGAAAQYSAQNEAKYIAMLKAVVNYKIDDQENIRDIEALRQNRQFNEKLQRMLDKLSNERTKDAKNRRVLKVLEQAGVYKRTPEGKEAFLRFINQV